jgi:hypothetical protein
MVVDANVTQNGTVFILLFIPFVLTCICALGKFLFDDGLLFVNYYFDLRYEERERRKNTNYDKIN